MPLRVVCPHRWGPLQRHVTNQLLGDGRLADCHTDRHMEDMHAYTHTYTHKYMMFTIHAHTYACTGFHNYAISLELQKSS